MRWIDVEEPTPALVTRALDNLGVDVHPLDVADILSPAQRPKLERRESYLFAVVRLARTGRRHVQASELDALVIPTSKTLVTFHGKELTRIREAMSDATLFAAKRRDLLSRGPDAVLSELLRRTFDDTYAATDQISRQIEQLESNIFEKHSRATTFEVANLRRTITDYRKIAKPQAAFLRELGSAVSHYLGDHTQAYWRSLPQIADSQWELLEGFQETIVALADTNTTLVSHRLNETFRILTIITTLFLPATFLSQVFAIEVPGLPFKDLEYGLLIIVGVLILAEVSFIWALRRLKVL